MKNNEIAIWSCGRISSQRCKNKMIRKFCNTTLTDIFLSKISSITNNCFFAGYDKIFKEKCSNHGVRFVQRTKESSIVDEPASEIYSFLNDQDYKYLLLVNACLPLLSTDTIKDFYNRCLNLTKPAFAVFEVNNYYLNENFQPINFNYDLKTINTKKVKKINEFAHVFYFFEKNYFVKHGWYWDWNELEYIVIDKNDEMIDIDTEQDFILAENMYKNKFLGNTIV